MILCILKGKMPSEMNKIIRKKRLKNFFRPVTRTLLLFLFGLNSPFLFCGKLTVCPMGNFSGFFCHLLIFFKINFFEKSFFESLE